MERVLEKELLDKCQHLTWEGKDKYQRLPSENGRFKNVERLTGALRNYGYQRLCLFHPQLRKAAARSLQAGDNASDNEEENRKLIYFL